MATSERPTSRPDKQQEMIRGYLSVFAGVAAIVGGASLFLGPELARSISRPPVVDGVAITPESHRYQIRLKTIYNNPEYVSIYTNEPPRLERQDNTHYLRAKNVACPPDWTGVLGGEFYCKGNLEDYAFRSERPIFIVDRLPEADK